jgi:nucleoside-diphosphate-sugar epimerase
LLPTLIEATHTKDTVDLTDGTQLRDFVFVNDVATGLLLLGIAPAEPGEVVNLASGILTSVKQFTQNAAGALGISPERLRFGALPTRPDEMEHLPVSIDRLRNLTGWMPATPIAQGVGKSILFRKNSRNILLDHCVQPVARLKYDGYGSDPQPT